MLREDSKHRPLVVRPQVEEAVPCENAVETLSQPQAPHVGHEPSMEGEAAAA
jgi:hypothetical protein